MYSTARTRRRSARKVTLASLLGRPRHIPPPVFRGGINYGVFCPEEDSDDSDTPPASPTRPFVDVGNTIHRDRLLSVMGQPVAAPPLPTPNAQFPGWPRTLVDNTIHRDRLLSVMGQPVAAPPLPTPNAQLPGWPVGWNHGLGMNNVGSIPNVPFVPPFSTPAHLFPQNVQPPGPFLGAPNVPFVPPSGLPARPPPFGTPAHLLPQNVQPPAPFMGAPAHVPPAPQFYGQCVPPSPASPAPQSPDVPPVQIPYRAPAPPHVPVHPPLIRPSPQRPHIPIIQPRNPNSRSPPPRPSHPLNDVHAPAARLPPSRDRPAPPRGILRDGTRPNPPPNHPHPRDAAPSPARSLEPIPVVIDPRTNSPQAGPPVFSQVLQHGFTQLYWDICDGINQELLHLYGALSPSWSELAVPTRPHCRRLTINLEQLMAWNAVPAVIVRSWGDIRIEASEESGVITNGDVLSGIRHFFNRVVTAEEMYQVPIDSAYYREIVIGARLRHEHNADTIFRSDMLRRMTVFRGLILLGARGNQEYLSATLMLSDHYIHD